MENPAVVPAAPTSAVPAAKDPSASADDMHGDRGFVSTSTNTTNVDGSATVDVSVMNNTKAVSEAADESQCELRFLMVNGESFRMVVPASFSVQDVKKKVIDERPPELVEFLKDSKPSVTSGPSSVEEIRILHLGKFLEDAKTLKECNFDTGADNLTAVHIWVRVPANASEDVKEKVNKKGSGCCSVM